MNKYKKLLNNSILFAIGNFGSKIINLVMVPLYTFVLSPSEYGEVDLLTTTISLLLPVASISIGEAVIRFSIQNNSDEKKKDIIITNAVLFNLSMCILILGLFPILQHFELFNGLLPLFILQLIFSTFQVTISQFTRGIGLVKQFAINGVIMTIVTASLNVLFLVQLNLGTAGYILSLIAANLISIVYLSFATKIFYRISLKKFDFKVFKKMLVYSVPLIPNMIMWWVISGSTRYFILFFLTPAANGLFAVANKIPSILSMFTTIFQQAWQISAFEEYDSKSRGEFFSKIFNLYSQFLFIGTFIPLFLMKPFFPMIVNHSYQESWKIIPGLLVAVTYQSLSSFLGTNYTASLKTKGVFTSSVIGAVISVIFNVLCIPVFGVVGAGISSCMSFIVLFVIRYFETKKMVSLKINSLIFFANNIVIIFQIFTMYLIDDIFLTTSVELILIVGIVFININLIKKSFCKLYKLKKKSLKKIPN